MKYTEKDHTFAICAYKESPYLEACIDSLINQTKKSKIIICTSTPNDFIKRTAEKYGIELFVREGKSGLSQDWNYAADCTKTALYTLCHQDDYYFETYAEKIISCANRHPHPIIIYTGYAEDKNGKLERTNMNLKIKDIMNCPMKFERMQRSVWVRRRILSLGNPICCPSVSFCKEEMGKEVFDPHFKNAADWDMWERLSKRKGSFVYCPETLMAHRVHEGSTTTQNIANNIRKTEDLILFKRFWPDILARGIAKVFSLSEKNNG